MSKLALIETSEKTLIFYPQECLIQFSCEHFFPLRMFNLRKEADVNRQSLDKTDLGLTSV